MPRRKTPLITGNFYHLFNRSIYRQPILSNKRDAELFLDSIYYYTQAKPPTKFSYYRKSPNAYPADLTNKLVTVISYCLMPNHFHLTVRQDEENGIKTFLQRVLNSFSHYYRKKYEGHGPLFESVFKAVRVETDEQLVHLSRYHHLNPVTSHLVEHPADYKFSSYNTYIKGSKLFIDTSFVLSHFKTPKQYEDFVLSRKAYQRELDEIKHLLFK